MPRKGKTVLQTRADGKGLTGAEKMLLRDELSRFQKDDWISGQAVKDFVQLNIYRAVNAEMVMTLLRAHGDITLTGKYNFVREDGEKVLVFHKERCKPDITKPEFPLFKF